MDKILLLLNVYQVTKKINMRRNHKSFSHVSYPIWLGFLRVVFPKGGGINLSYFKKNLSNININLYNY